MSPTRDEILTVHDWWDGPRAGLATYRGEPHAYRSLWREDGEAEQDSYLLLPVDAAMAELLLEDYRSFLRWRAAFDRGEVDSESHPALPEDRDRHDERHPLVSTTLEVSASDVRAFKVQATIDYEGERTFVAWTLA